MALQMLMQQQALSYNFEFYPITFEHAVSVLVLSEGRSMLPVDVHVAAVPGNDPAIVPLTEEDWDVFRW